MLVSVAVSVKVRDLGGEHKTLHFMRLFFGFCKSQINTVIQLHKVSTAPSSFMS